MSSRILTVARDRDRKSARRGRRPAGDAESLARWRASAHATTPRSDAPARRSHPECSSTSRMLCGDRQARDRPRSRDCLLPSAARRAVMFEDTPHFARTRSPAVQGLHRNGGATGRRLTHRAADGWSWSSCAVRAEDRKMSLGRQRERIDRRKEPKSRVKPSQRSPAFTGSYSLSSRRSEGPGARAHEVIPRPPSAQVPRYARDDIRLLPIQRVERRALSRALARIPVAQSRSSARQITARPRRDRRWGA